MLCHVVSRASSANVSFLLALNNFSGISDTQSIHLRCIMFVVVLSVHRCACQ